MFEKHLHIVCFDVPYPVDHGGIFDLYYKIVLLHKHGVKIHLHCFEYGRGEQEELDKYCDEVIYYQRSTGFKGFSFSLPYIVSSRRSEALLFNLQKDDYPILFEGIHCTYLLYINALPGRKVFVRLHNVEYKYYAQLAKSTRSVFKKLYFLHESSLLKEYEKKIASNAIFLAVSALDSEIYKKDFAAHHIEYLPVFIPYTSVKARPGKGSYCLYHGNLSVPENEKAVMWLLQNVFKDSPYPFVVAGKDPTEKLRTIIHKNNNVCLIANPSEGEMNDLIAKAHVNILPSFNSTGVKIKLLNALFNSKFCLVNNAAVELSGLEKLCVIADDAATYKEKLAKLCRHVFSEEEIEKRQQVLSWEYDNEENARQLIQWIY